MPTDTTGSHSAVVREAVTADLAAIREIYNYHVLNTTVTFEINPQTEEVSNAWFELHMRENLPTLVAEDNGRIVGWASLSYYNPRCAYRTSVEPSVYIHQDYLRHGVGKLLMTELIAAAEKRHYHCLVGLVCTENEASLKWIRHFGFEPVGELIEIGRKFDRWLNVMIMQKVLDT